MKGRKEGKKIKKGSVARTVNEGVKEGGEGKKNRNERKEGGKVLGGRKEG